MSSKKMGTSNAEKSAKNSSSEMSAFRAYILNSTKSAKTKAENATDSVRSTANTVKEGTKSTMSNVKKTTEEVTKTAKSAAKTVKAAATDKAATTKTVAKKTATATKTAAKKTADTAKATAKKAAAKKAAPKTTVELQFAGKSVSYDALVNMAKEAFVNAGHNAADMKTVALYVKPEESMVYYVINDEQGSFAI